MANHYLDKIILTRCWHNGHRTPIFKKSGHSSMATSVTGTCRRKQKGEAGMALRSALFADCGTKGSQRNRRARATHRNVVFVRFTFFQVRQRLKEYETKPGASPSSSS